MAVLSVRKYGDPVLRRRAKPVEKVTPELRAIIADMIDTMYDEVCIGLAAPQVGISKRVIVVDIGDGPIALVNPRLEEFEGEEMGPEGCLSGTPRECPTACSHFPFPLAAEQCALTCVLSIKRNLDDLRAMAADPERARQFLLRSSMIASQRRADSLELEDA